jgi:hypothetical protein
MVPMGEALWGYKDSRLDKVSNSNHSGAWAGQWVKTRGFSKWDWNPKGDPDAEFDEFSY